MGIPDPWKVSTKLEQLAELARQAPEMVFHSIHHRLDLPLLHASYAMTRKDGATGVDGVTSAEYAENLDENLRDLLERFRSGTYRAPAVLRVHLPKGKGKTRPIGIPTFEDKVLQRAVGLLLGSIYEQDFLSCSFGFRPGRSAHQALTTLRKRLRRNGGWVIELDIERFFDTLDHGHLRDILDQRVRDGVIRRAINKWLKAGVMEGSEVRYGEAGTPQGGVISPLLANVYLHEVLDRWFVEQIQPRLRGRGELVRYADDAVLVFEREDDARRVYEVLPKRMNRYGLHLHPTKTRLVPFGKPRATTEDDDEDSSGGDSGPGTFDFLGFTHYWGRSVRGGYWVVKRKTAKDRLRRALHQMAQWCRRNRNLPLAQQHAMLSAKLRGHYAYYGLPGNARALSCFWWSTRAIWRMWLDRRSQRGRMTWWRFELLSKRYPLPPVKMLASQRLVASP
jgi:RNA-directed DNA polymerase